jgi:hypothetical protein
MINRRSYLGIPMARRRNRRLLVAAYWVSVLAILISASEMFYRSAFPKHWWTIFIAGGLIGSLIAFLGGAGQIGPVADFDGDTTPPSRWIPLEMADALVRRLRGDRSENRIDAAMDERDIRLRNAAHYEAYRVLREIVLPALIAAFVIFHFFLTRYEYISIPIYCLLLLVIYNLPQSLILWWEPDIEEL